MDRKNHYQKSKIATCVVALLAVGLGCLCLPTGVTPTPAPVAGPTATAVPATQPPVIDGGGLNPTGPWLMMETDQGLWAANPDGSGLTQFTQVDYWKGELQQAVQPGGSQVAFITPGDYTFGHMALNLLTLPEGTVTKITDLTTPETEAYSGSGPGDPGYEALRAVGERTSYAWSPDGSQLAFAGVMDGPSAEIYLYDVASGQIQRVSQDEAQDFAPTWSPDGQHLLYLGAVGFGTGAGMAMAGVWIAAGDGSGAAQLYPSSSGGEHIVGWLDYRTAVIDSWSIMCGPSELRLYDVVSRQQTMLNEGCITSATAEALYGSAMYSDESGVFLLTAENRTPIQVSHESGSTVDLREPGDQVFTVRYGGGGLGTYGTGEIDNQVSPVYVRADRMQVAEYGAIWGWTSADDVQPGAWITGPGLDVGQIYTGKAFFPIWTLDNNLIFFAEQGSGYDIYITTFSGYYQDLTTVNHIEGTLRRVLWLGLSLPG